jgi:26S proteasome regulatory subunit N1
MPSTEEKATPMEVVSDKKVDKKKKEAGDELSEEDKALKEGLELAVLRLAESTSETEVGVLKLALDHLAKEIKSATSSMTSVPKPLKFLRPHYDTLKNIYNR